MMTEETLEQKITRLNNIPPNDPSHVWAQLNLGEIYTKENSYKNIDKAIEHYSLIHRDNSSELYALAQLNLGDLFSKENSHKDINKAMKHYYLVHHEDSSVLYAWAQYELGDIFSHVNSHKNTKKAIVHYNQVTHDDSSWLYANAQLKLGDIYMMKNRHKDIEKAMEHYNNVTYIKNTFDVYIEAKIKCCFITDDIIKTKSFALNSVQPIVKNLTNIHDSCKMIRNQLLVTFDAENQYEKTIAHYTKPSVLFLLLKQTSQFRLNLVDFMNDPSENKVLLNWLNVDALQTNPDIKNFVASFSFNHHSLNQFRLYGLEGDQTGTGISLTVTSRFFCSDNDNSIDFNAINGLPNKLLNAEIINESQTEETLNTIFPLPLYRCIYFDPNTNYLALAKRSKQSFYLEHKTEHPDKIEKRWQKYLKSLQEEQKINEVRKQLALIKNEIATLHATIAKHHWQTQLKDINQWIALATMPISSLVKHAAFEDENECRIFYVTDIGDDKVHVGESFNESKQIYLEYANIADYIDKIYLGPKCQPQHKLWLENHKKKNQLTIRRIIQSDMPLQ